jgi:hypothetical protein
LADAATRPYGIDPAERDSEWCIWHPWAFLDNSHLNNEPTQYMQAWNYPLLALLASYQKEVWTLNTMQSLKLT